MGTTFSITSPKTIVVFMPCQRQHQNDLVDNDDYCDNLLLYVFILACISKNTFLYYWHVFPCMLVGISDMYFSEVEDHKRCASGLEI